ncbi:hypothetical protein [Rhodocyclus tenuis]|uniref:Uncharacterized protein n=1 Tax=Rhodocyclus tenuis TaxID=1066 RepID=A0A840GIR3_RHOTE|nr:hypothetical protein [Rhodocyclus tenuis]MBB4248352.1 hypothetical protein [Rhodocyclus tenuis]
MPLIPETITWHTGPDDLPDADETVLTANDDPGDVWPGYFDGEQWRNADGFPIDPPKAWSAMPSGPGARQ